jgi:hypothetical protein
MKDLKWHAVWMAMALGAPVLLTAQTAAQSPV